MKHARCFFFSDLRSKPTGAGRPFRHGGSTELIEGAFDHTVEIIRNRVRAFLALRFEHMSPEQLKAELALIGTLGA